ncbi:hypothetical protein CHRYSEOSP005_06950 [Chryseobacterium sp. Alg-005]|uniref:hypothetical protein n=1 Tax=Chryseobacterium sp. Alg-005 TaxID=3159516 RepID=UPI0035559015
MKNIFILIAALFFNSFSAQVAIGKTSVASPSVSLDFGTANRGMILPWVNSTGAVTGVVNGTMVYDLTDKKVKVKYASGWKDLSIDTTGTTVDPLTSVDGVTIQNAASETATAKTAIGTPTATPGILVLEDTNKAMVLPKVASPHLNIINPAPGMMVYDTTAKLLAVFNGSVWTFWKQ